ncbi:iron complex outermembrane receptor protein [Pseudomonas sp. BIGb0408]|uniref:Metal-pseudopaline receptor CntO n=1 Tax=Phytopseudomonas flavescens TaxID=29435 RepID=A0A7Z0BRD7_9GAMM|nr:iron complex outermembrane receptor protein [Pseudomonas sp. BIGb0408]NYH74108.1 iron complex outermembrane receptor protein [Pseudomonas flavescens]
MNHRTMRRQDATLKHVGLAALLLSTGMLPLAPPALAQAVADQAATYAFAIPAQPLPQALDAFSRTTGLNVVYTDEAPYAVQASALQGRMSVEQALARLLAGSGFTFARAGAGTITLQAVPADGAVNLGAVNIQSQRTTAYSYQPPETTSLTRSDTPLLDIPQAVAVVPAQVLQDQQPQNLDDALVNVSGITQSNTLGSTLDAVMKRGFGDNRDGSILRDGMRTIQGRNFTATAERVEVLKGPSSMLYGILDPGGVINVVSKKPQLESYRAITGRASTFGHGKNGSGGTLDLTGPLGETGLAYRLIADYDDADYWRSFGTNRDKTFAPSLAWYGEDTTVTLSHEYREYSVPFDRGTVFVNGKPLDIPSERRLDEPYNVTEGRSNLSIFDLSHQLNDDWKAHFAYSYNRDTYDDYQARVTSVNTSNGTVGRRLDGTRGAVSTSHFATFDLDGRVELGGMRHDLLMGVDHEYRKFYREDLIRQTTTRRLDYNQPIYGLDPVPTTVVASDSDQTDRVVTQSAFIQDSIHLNEQWIFVAGARYQLYDQLAGRGRPFNKNTDINGQLWMPRVGLVYKLNDELSLYGGYSESFKPNSTIAPQSGIGSVNEMAPEEGKSWELGAKLDMPGRITGTLALFDIVKENVSVLDLEGYRRAAGEVRSRGVELDLTGQLTDRISLIGTFAFTDAEVTKDPSIKGNQLQNVARQSASLSAVYDLGALLGGDRLRVGTGARYVGDRQGDSDNTFTLPLYTVADAFASYETRLGENKLRLQLNAKNLFDKTYYSSSVNSLNVSIGEPRQLQLSSTLEF